MARHDLEDGKDTEMEEINETARSPTNSTIEKVPVTPATPPAPVADGGVRAWLQVAGSFLVFSNLWGFVFAFGSFQSFYTLDYLPSESASDIAWIGTIGTGLLIFVGILSGPLFDLGYFRSMLIIGGVGETLAMFLLSLCTKYWQILLTQGIMVGLFNGLLYLPGLALVGRSFKKHRSMAMAITTCGAPTGGIIYTLLFQQLIGKLGFAWTVRTMAFFMLGTYAISFPLQLWGASNLGDLASGTKREMFDPTALRDLPFWSYSFANFFIFTGYMVPFIYLGAYGQTELGLTQTQSLNVLIAAQAASIAGRLIAGYTASKVGVMIPWITAAISSGVFCIAWIGIKSENSLIVFACLFGAFSGPLIPLPPAVFPLVCPDPTVFGQRLGMAQAIGSVASLIGAPIAGALLGKGGGRDTYLGLQLFSGLVMIFGGCQLVVLYMLLLRKREVGKLI
ncbi:hypothetical protein LTR35_008182 [Friedmanniomyces endolithicus]|uniref:Major facilitator superfamily (MFS) profile domain-containing protein n=1 Tax=Friedmanniomyces endolithicus TaxID=329885 RepID=A0AAN6J0V4_9PEZI|nr:hypothetical protein LTR35_008182 [Friedmanniomyces endolithicus]KAK0296203.1 hypothetical protein LTS00_005035 [Friedmanniomyces endolithicus]KAK0305457.1 hypothetical protein LTR82_016762 [Friedmanniomyces endolithicus]KAK1001449.1 hypothetical protein LTR54_008345 [Friedmanniomyces endolithicus]